MVYFLIPILLSCVHEYSAHQAYKLGAVQDQQLLTLEIQVGTSSETVCAIRCQRDANCRSSVFNGTSCSLLDYNPCPEMTPGDMSKMTKAGFTEECSSISDVICSFTVSILDSCLVAFGIGLADCKLLCLNVLEDCQYSQYQQTQDKCTLRPGELSSDWQCSDIPSTAIVATKGLRP